MTQLKFCILLILQAFCRACNSASDSFISSTGLASSSQTSSLPENSSAKSDLDALGDIFSSAPTSTTADASVSFFPRNAFAWASSPLCHRACWTLTRSLQLRLPRSLTPVASSSPPIQPPFLLSWHRVQLLHLLFSMHSLLLRWRSLRRLPSAANLSLPQVGTIIVGSS